jgi:hypothetical protein
MSIGDTMTRVIIVIEHPQIQLAFIIPIYIKQVYYYNTHRNHEHLRTYCYRTIFHIIELYRCTITYVTIIHVFI